MAGQLWRPSAEGITVGAVIQGFSVTGRAYSGGPFDWFTAFNFFCGAGLVVAYALLGSTWLVMKSENALQKRMRQVSKVLLLLLLVFIAIISIWTPLAQPAIAARWFTLPNLFYLLPVPALVAILSLCQWRCLHDPASHTLPFIMTLGLVFLGFSGLGISIWPHIIPPDITLWQAAAPAQSRGLYVSGCTVDHSRDSGLHLLELLRFSRKSTAWGGLSLMQQPVWKRLMWLAIIWGGSVLGAGLRKYAL